MAERIKSFFGGRTREQKRAERQAERSQAMQARAAEEDAQKERAERNAAGRRLRGAGRRQLTWNNSEAGLAPTLGG